MKTVVLALLIGWLVFEFIEHVVLPLVWVVRLRRKRSMCGPSGMIGKVGEIRSWNGGRGKIFVNGELWRAVGESDFAPGEKAQIRRVEGLTVKVGRPEAKGGG